MNASRKIDAILEYLGISAAALAKRLDYNRPQVIYDILKGKTKSISEQLADKITSVYPQIRRAWLLASDGEMIDDDVTPIPTDPKYKLIPLLNVDSVGGMSSYNDVVDTQEYIERLVPFENAQDGDVAIYQSGNSMSPTIPAGTILQIRAVQDWREYFGYGDVYVLELNDGRRITKEISKYDPNPKEYVLCISYNPDYPDEELPRSMIKGVWRVINMLVKTGW